MNVEAKYRFIEAKSRSLKSSLKSHFVAFFFLKFNCDNAVKMFFPYSIYINFCLVEYQIN